ncbi:Alpha-18 giardin [Giardia muris]|uniref:Alpha-18 giardin n=1 Tax=Giardia muris TaxID=5742 RepID=A0A4Z1TAB2_GIAMU|nr:Alpha-18 giardin [Giardia muris]|eukprot:TNJ29449.1 Alpha-18 giardin [Giardia muris]
MVETRTFYTLAMELEELITQRDPLELVYHSTVIPPEHREEVATMFHSHFGRSLNAQIQEQLPPSSTRSLLINFWMDPLTLRLRLFERSIKDNDPWELIHCVMTTPKDMFLEICDAFNTQTQRSLYSAIRNFCIGSDPWRVLLRSWIIHDTRSVANVTYLVSRIREAVAVHNTELLVETLTSATPEGWNNACEQYERVYGETVEESIRKLYKDVDLFAILFGHYMLTNEDSAIAMLLRDAISIQSSDMMAVATALYSSGWCNAVLLYPEFSDDLDENYSKTFAEAVKRTWGLI